MDSQEVTRKMMGMDTELLHIGGEPVKLYLLSGDRFGTSQCFKSGDLSLQIIRDSGSPVAMASCMVGDHHWMLAKDSKVLRVNQGAFVIALPGFLYGLVSPGCGRADSERLQEVFKRFCDYNDILESELGEEMEAETDLWRRAYTKIEKLIGRLAGKVPGTADSQNTSKKLQRAVRTSALVKLVSRTLLSGALNPLKHVNLAVAPGLRQGPGLGNCGPYVLPSMWSFADILDAMETGCLLSLPPMPKATSPAGQGGCWYFNREGMAVLLELVKAHGGPGNGRVAKKPRLDSVVEEAEEKGTTSE